MVTRSSKDKFSGSLGGIARATKSRNFNLYCAGLGVSLTGSFVFFAAIGWVAWELTNSAAWVGTIVLAETLPNAIIGPFAGVIIDRTSARLALFWAQLVAAIIMVGLSVVTFAGLLTVEMLLGFALVIGSLNGIAFPAHFAIMPQLVPREDLSPAIAFQSSISQGARFIGPAIAGGLLVWGGGGLAFGYKALSYISFLIALWMIKIDKSDEPITMRSGVIRDFIDGIQYAWSNFSMRLLLVIGVALGILLRPIIELMAAYVGSVLDAGAGSLAWLLAGVGAGATLASLWLARRGTTRGLTRIMQINFAITAVTLVPFLMFGQLAIGVGILIVYGFCSSAVLICNQTLIQTAVDDQMRARVMGLYALTVRAIPALGAFVVGQLADILGIVPSILGGAGLALVFWVWSSLIARRNKLAEAVEQDRATTRS